MYTVTVSGERANMPVACACCLGVPNTTVIANKEKVLHLGVARIRRTFKVDVPYCTFCKDHALEHQIAQPGQVFLGAFGVLVLVGGLEYCAGSCALKAFPSLEPPPGPNPLAATVLIVAVLLPWVLALVFLVKGLMRKPPIVKMPPHARALTAVEVIDFSPDGFTLDFHNREFARRFAEANAALVQDQPVR